MLGRRLLPFPTTTIANRQQQRCRIAFSSSAGAPPPQQSASLYHEWYHPPVSEGVDKKIKKNRRPLVFLHGLLGNVRNVKSMAKKMCDIHNCPGLLLDLTGHGRSSIHSTVGSVTFDRVCDDLERTLREVLLVPMNHDDNDDEEPNNTFTFVGHSLGGRLALHYAHNVSRSPRPTSLWLLDTVPGQPNESVLAVLEAAFLVSQRHSWRSRFELTTALTTAYHLPKPIAEWLAAQYDIQYQRFDFDLRAAESLADDFGCQDFWHQIDTLLPQMQENNNQRRRHNNKNQKKNSSPPPPSSSTTTTNNSSLLLRTIHLVQGGRNEAWEPAVPAITERTNQYPGTFCHHLLPNAGHWVHVDDLPGLLRAFETATAGEEDL
jgi:pimeloyl-ACP methyl ester carboxylesterase